MSNEHLETLDELNGAVTELSNCAKGMVLIFNVSAAIHSKYNETSLFYEKCNEFIVNINQKLGLDFRDLDRYESKFIKLDYLNYIVEFINDRYKTKISFFSFNMSFHETYFTLELLKQTVGLTA